MPDILPSLYTFLISVIPLTGLVASIPIGHIIWDLPIWWTAILSLIGNIIAAAILLKTLPKVIVFLDKRFFLVRQFFQWLGKNLKNPRTSKFVRLAEALLILFVALPLPFTGVWMGCLVAYSAGLKYTKSLSLIITGIVFSVIFVSLLTFGLLGLFNLVF